LRAIFFSIFLVLINTAGVGQIHKQKAPAGLLNDVDKSIQESAEQYKRLSQQLAPERFPVTWYATGNKLVTSGSEPWVGGFYPGSLLYLYEATKDTLLYQEALRKLKALEKEQFNTTTHDLGFMMYCSFGNAKRLSPKPAYDSIIINSAQSLASRFNERVGCIRSWDSDPGRFMVIIDNMMNLELLFAATRLTGDSSFYKIAVTHANTTLKNHFRPDHSSYHLVIYNPGDGSILKKQTVQGAADSSAWSRGQAWGLYGYTVLYRETKDPVYLQQANGIAQFILHHPHFPKDGIPYWDFDAPGIPATARDVSAGAIMCSALLELSAYVDRTTAKTYFATAENMLRSLCSPAYRAAAGENGGFLLKHGTGNYPKNADIDVPLIYADYYYLEAMLRYKTMAEEDTVVNRYRNYLLQQIQPAAKSIRTFTTTLTADGQWPDIPYNNTELANWQVSKHLDRIRDLAVAWAQPAGPFYHQEAVWKPMNAALNHWLQKRYQNPNWWHNQIGVPQFMRDIITLLRDTLTSDQLTKALAVMNQLKVQQNGAGANLVWSANLGFFYGALTHNWELMQRCGNLLLNEIAITTTEGIQPDFSFHQHGARLQMYQYGQAFLWENVRIAWLLRGTTLAYSEEKLDLLKALTLKGWQWMARGINTVPGTMDRSVSRIDALQSADIRKLIPWLCELWPKETQQFKTLEAIQNGKGSLRGYRYYPYSDFAVYHHKDFSFFVKTISTRTLATESINSENGKGHLLNSGDAYIVKSGDEYFNLMPVWNWERLPGITAFNGAYKINRQPFAGSVSDGTFGFSVMDYRLADKEQKQQIAARKYWANHGNVIVCLIAGLTAGNTDSEVYTTLDQCRWKGTITVNEPGHVIKEGTHELEQVKWIHHAGFAYIPLQPTKVRVQAQTVTGTWKSINNSLTDAPVTARVFMPELLHGAIINNLNTGYVLAACPTPQQAQSLLKRPGWKVLQNDTSCQAVGFPDGTIMSAFYVAGSLNINPNKTLTVDKPCLIMIAGKRLYASNPLHKEEMLAVQWNKQAIKVKMPDNGFTSNGVLLK